MDVSEFLTGTFLKADDLAAGPQVMTIKSVDKKDLQGEPKIVVAFHEVDKELTLNATRLKTLAKQFGPETAAWLGKRIMLAAQPIVSGKFAGQSTITIFPAQQQPQPQYQQPVQPQQQPTEVAWPVQ